MNIEVALEKLNSLLPLVERKRNLDAEHQIAHRNILNSFARYGKVDNNIEPSILNLLYENDLIVLDDDKNIVGAYPFSLRKTAHHISNENIDIFAMCAFDAVSIAPVFNEKIKTVSHCHITNEKIEIQQDSNKLIKVYPSEDIHIGIRWQSAGICAADNLCMEMVFLLNKDVALQWSRGDENFSIYSLADAIDFAVSYFKPLLQS